MKYFLACLLMAAPAYAGPGHHGKKGHKHHGKDHKHGKQGHKAKHTHGHRHDGPNATLGAILPNYLRLHKALARDQPKAAARAARKLGKIASKHSLTLVASAAERITGEDPKADRIAFYKISTQVVPLVLAHPQARKAYRVLECPTAPGRWVQRSGKPANPYHGEELRKCGERVGSAEEKPKDKALGKDEQVLMKKAEEKKAEEKKAEEKKAEEKKPDGKKPGAPHPH